MADTKISALTSASALAGTEVFPVVQASTTKKTTIATIATYIQSIAINLLADFAIATNKFTVAAASGNTAIAGTLGVTGAATFGSTVGVTGTLTAGNLATGGTLAATGAATLGSTLAVTGAATLSSTLAAGASTLASLAVTDGATIGTTLGVTGAATLSSTLAVTGISTFVAAPSAFATYSVGSRKERTDTAGNLATGVFESVADPSGASSALTSGIIGYAATKAGNVKTLPGLGLTGVRGVVANAGGGVVGSAASFYAPAITNTGAGSITSIYGVYIAAQTAGANNWGLYVENNASYAGGTASQWRLGTGSHIAVTGNTTTGAMLSYGSYYDGTNHIPTTTGSGQYRVVAAAHRWYLNSTGLTAGVAYTPTQIAEMSDADGGRFWLGTGPTFATSYGIGVNKTSTNLSGTLIASAAQIIANPASASTGVFSAFYGLADTVVGNTSSITALYALRAGVRNLGDGAIANAAGLHIAAASNTGAGSITINYGVRVESQTAGVSNYALYTAGTADKNYFGSNTMAAGGGHQFGTTAQTYVTNCLVGARVTDTATSGTEAVFSAHSTPAPATASTAVYVAVSGYVASANANTAGASFYGGFFEARSDNDSSTVAGTLSRARPNHAAGQTIANGYGLYASYAPSSTGTTTTGYGIRGEVAPTGVAALTTATVVSSNLGLSTAASVTTAYSFYGTASNSGGATVGTYYGLRLSASASYATTTWGVYVDSAKSNFGGGLIAGAPVQHASYTVGTLPAAATWPRGEAYCSDETGGATLVFSDGTNWRRHSDRAIAA